MYVCMCMCVCVCVFTQLVKISPSEDPPEKGWATHSSIIGLPWWLRQ